jgi:hypothetical protein
MRAMVPISASLNGLYDAAARYERASKRVVNSVSAGKGGAIAAVAGQKQAETAFAANVSAYRTAARTQQRLLDIMV